MSSYGTGIASNVASPDEAARALQTAFQPTGYAGGGQVINGVKHFQQGGENQSSGRSFLGGMFRLPDPNRVLVPKRYTPVMQEMEDMSKAKAIDDAALAYDQDVRDQNPNNRGDETIAQTEFGRNIRAVLPKGPTSAEAVERQREIADGIKRNRQMMESVETVRNAPTTSEGSTLGDLFRTLTPGQFAARELARKNEIDDSRAAAGASAERLPPPAGGIAALPGAAAAAAAPPRAAEKPPEASTAPTVPPPADRAGAGAAAKKDEESGLGKRLSLRIDELKQEREANKAQQKENQLLALMQAGFQAAAGKSSNALSNIAAGGAAGIATLADLEKTRRAEDSSLRKEGLELELAKEKMMESRAERGSQREMLAAQRQQSLLQNVTVNARQEVSAINSTIANEEAKLLNPAITEDQKAPIRAEINRLKNQRDVASQQLYDVYAQMGLRRPMTPEQSGMPPAGSKIIQLPGGTK
jgi:hypothetical protein